MRHLTAVLLLFSLFTLIVIIGIIGMLIKKQRKFLPQMVAVYAALLVFIFFEAIGFFNTPVFVLAFVFISVLLHTLVGEFLDVYHKSTTFDRWLHLVGTFAFTLFCYSIIDNTLNPPPLPGAYVFIYVSSLGITLGTMFEIIEFFGDKATQNKPRLPAQHGLKDTDTDMIFNAAGAILAGVAAIFMYS